MSDSNSKILEIEQGLDHMIQKITALSDLVKNQEERIDMLTKSNDQFSAENTALKTENSRLQTELQAAQSAGDNTPVVDEAAYNHKINELVKEINSCIALLNK